MALAAVLRLESRLAWETALLWELDSVLAWETALLQSNR
jgi:hypothetical protein